MSVRYCCRGILTQPMFPLTPLATEQMLQAPMAPDLHHPEEDEDNERTQWVGRHLTDEDNAKEQME